MIGEIAALATALLWSCSSILFTFGGRYVGSTILNRTRLIFGLVYLSILHFIIFGKFLPVTSDLNAWLWLGLSGIVGLVLGDSALFQAFVLIGPHLSMLIMTLVPIVSTIFAWFFLHESLTVVKLLGIVCTLIGIIMVLLNKKDTTTLNKKQFAVGILCGIGGAFGQAIGLILAKKGLANNLPGLSATIIRVSTASLVIWLLTLISGRAKMTIRKIADKKIIWIIALGAFCGPFFGIWMSMVAVKWAYVGVASTIMALPPVFLLPLSHFIFKDKVTNQAIIGTIIAVIGTAIIFIL
jgi:drug/metabolite transporter (DMT)-like permease